MLLIDSQVLLRCDPRQVTLLKGKDKFGGACLVKRTDKRLNTLYIQSNKNVNQC